MRVRPFVAVAAAAALVATMPAHAKGPSYKTLDGKATKTLTFKDTITTPQDNDKDIAQVLNGPDRWNCAPPRCARFTFIYKPAKKVKSAPFSVRIAWTYPVEDFDLYVVPDNGDKPAQCAGGAGTSELVIDGDLFPGHKYTVVIDHYRALPDTVTATVKFPTTEKMPTTAPSAVDSKQPVNCGLSSS